MKINNLILLCGFSRSGTTWVSKIFDSIPSTYLISEPDKRVNKNLKFGKVLHCTKESDYNSISAYRDSLSEVSEKLDCNLRSFPFFDKKYLSLPYPIYNFSCLFFQLTNSFANKCNQSSINFPSLFYKKNNNVTLIWKTVNQSSNIPFIQKAFPDIKIIYLIRNPYSTIASLMNHNKMKLDGADFRRILERKDSLYCQLNNLDYKAINEYSEIEKKALLWRIESESAYMAGEKADNFYFMTYENLVTDLQSQIRKVFSFSGMEFTQEVKQFLNQSSGKEGPPLVSRFFSGGYFGVYRKPGINFKKWKKVIDRENYDRINSVVKDSPLLAYWDNEILSYD